MNSFISKTPLRSKAQREIDYERRRLDKFRHTSADKEVEVEKDVDKRPVEAIMRNPLDLPNGMSALAIEEFACKTGSHFYHFEKLSSKSKESEQVDKKSGLKLRVKSYTKKDSMMNLAISSLMKRQNDLMERAKRGE